MHVTRILKIWTLLTYGISKKHQFQALSGEKILLNYHLWDFWSAMFPSWSLIPYFCHLTGKFQFLDLRLCDANGTSPKNLLPNGGESMMMNLMAQSFKITQKRNFQVNHEILIGDFLDPYAQLLVKESPYIRSVNSGQCQRLWGIILFFPTREPHQLPTSPPEPRTCELRPRESAKYLGRKPTKHCKGWKVGKVGTRQQKQWAKLHQF